MKASNKKEGGPSLLAQQFKNMVQVLSAFDGEWTKSFQEFRKILDPSSFK